MSNLIILGDTHTAFDVLDSIIDHEKDACAVLHVGDLGVYDGRSPNRLSAREKRILENHGNDTSGFTAFLKGDRELSLGCYVLAGNHEDFRLLDELTTSGTQVGGFVFMRHDRCYTLDVGYRKFKVMGIGRILPEGLSPRRRHERQYIDEQQLGEFIEVARRERPDILMLHEPPLFRKEPRGPGIGSSHLRHAVQEIGAEFVFSGHLHFEFEGGIGGSKICGVGNGARGRYCLLAPSGVRWCSLDGSKIEPRQLVHFLNRA